MKIPIYKVDSFTDVPFAGNPAGVCFLAGARADTWMQAIAVPLSACCLKRAKKRRPRLFSSAMCHPQILPDQTGQLSNATSHLSQQPRSSRTCRLSHWEHPGGHGK